MSIFQKEKHKYEYKVLTEIIYDDSQLSRFLTDQGDMGWRVINITYEKTTDLEDVPCKMYKVIFESAY